MLHVPDETVEKALGVLNSGRHSTARLLYEKKDRERKVILARLEREANDSTQRARETYALTHPHYSAFLEELDIVEKDYFAAKDERDWAAALIEAWRTAQANARYAERIR